MFVTELIAYTAAALGFVFVLVCLACGLYYLAEAVEEYTTTTKRVIKYLLIYAFVSHVMLLIFEKFPVWLVLFSMGAHVIYSSLIVTFPLIEILSLKFIASCLLLITDHVFWFMYFAEHHYTFSQVVGIFLSCVWLVPFSFFISLSANEPVLPGGSSTPSPTAKDKGLDYRTSKGRLGLLSFFKFLSVQKEEIIPTFTYKYS
eukprot:TRINITY_DN9230_c0_g1_i2.p1 TRINITY_DN9230_c0_g1~~TRINITY_DN9230_c0_g1_i2.p1  ORF type:complete len:202 (-),score=38.04 TRINITY_DN9230_c0_g1_i2:119-724(-)